MYNAEPSAYFGVLLVLMSSCFRDPKAEREKFIRAHRTDSFAAFQDKNIFIRGLDHDGNAAVFFMSPLVDSLCSRTPSIVIVHASRKEQKVVSVDYKLLKPECKAHVAEQEANVRQLVEQFMQYDISFLHADAKGNVYVGVTPHDEIDVIKIGSQSNPQESEVDLFGYANVGDGWYTKE